MDNYIDQLQSSFDELNQLQYERAEHRREAEESQIRLPYLLSGHAMFTAMKRAVDDLKGRAPEDHDILIQIGGLSVLEAHFIEPHTFLFEGINEGGHRSAMVCHFTQVIVTVIYREKRDEMRVISRVIQGFSPNDPST